MATTVKITELTDIGANLATSTVVPVVNMAGTPTTQKTNIGNIANLILEGAGVDYPEASVALLAQTVSNAAQPNITSTGTLTTVAVSGNATVNGNITANGTAYVGNLSTTGLASITTLEVGSSADLGDVANVIIGGGTDGYVLQTDGTGNLSWTAQTGGGGNGVPGGSNTQVQFNDAGSFAGNSGFTFNKTTGILASPFLAGNGNGLSNVQVANVSGLGNIATANFDGNASNVLHGDGSWSADTTTYGNSNVATFLSAYGSNTITTTGNVSIGNLSTSGIVKIGNATITEINPIVLGFTDDIYVDGDVLSQRLKSNTGTVALNASNNTADTEWAFNVNGTLTLPQPIGNNSTSINSIYGNSSSFVDFVSNNSANFTFGTTANNNIVLIAGLHEGDHRWVFGQNGGLTFPGNTVAEDNIEGTGNFGFETPANVGFGILTDLGNSEWSFGADGNLTTPSNLVIGANIGGGSSIYQFDAPLQVLGEGANSALIVGWTANSSGPEDVVAIAFNNPLANGASNLVMGVGNNSTTVNYWTFANDGTTTFPTLTVDLHNGGNQTAQTLQFGDNTQQAIITGPTPATDNNAQRLIIQGQRASGTGEGGDVYFWAGDADLYGGDIKIYAGDADNASAGYGGYVNIEGGRGFDQGGYVRMTAGQSSNGQGAYAQIVGGYGVSGGDANITGGYGTAGPGGNINLNAGQSGNGLAEYGNVNIGAGASTWTFDNSGNLTLPKNINGLNNGSPIVIDAGITGNSYISIPSFTDGGEQLVIKNDYPSSQGIRIQTETGNFVLSSNSITFPDSTVQTTAYTGGGGNSISDGTSNVSVVSTDGNVVIGIDNDIASWTFATDGGIYSKAETDFKLIALDPNGDGYAVKQILNDGTQDLSMTSLEDGRFSIYTNLDGAGEEWRFNGNTLQVSVDSTVRSFGSNVVVESMYDGFGGIASLRSVSNQNEPNIYTTFDATTTGANISVYNGGSDVGPGYTWQFDNNGNLTAPGSILPGTANTFDLGNGSNYFRDAYFSNNVVAESFTTTDGGLTHSGTAVGINANAGKDIYLYADAANVGWTFDASGNLTLPGNTFAVNYANGTQVSLGGNYGDSNVVTLLSSFGSNTITTTGNVSVGNISGSTNGYTIGYRDIPQVVASNTTLAATDGGKHYYSTTAGNLTLTIPNNATTSFATGTAISIVVQAAGNILVNAASGVTLYVAGNSTAANRVVGAYGMATLMKVASDTWFINGTGVS